MPKFTKVSITVEADQWFKNGDHPEDETGTYIAPDGNLGVTEGRIVRRFNHPDVIGSKLCKKCPRPMREHGWIDTLEGGHIVCPGDWIITGIEGERYLCKDDIFNKTYVAVE